MFAKSSLLVLALVSLVAGNSTVYKNLEKLSSFDEFINILQQHLVRDDVNFTEECFQQLDEYTVDLRTFQPWALKMFDSMSKIPVGILHATAGDLGDFDECMAIATETSIGTINGKYCLGKIGLDEGLQKLYPENLKPKSSLGSLADALGLKMATCLPHACTTSDIQKFYSLFGIDYRIVDLSCQSEATKPELDELAIFAIVFFGVIGCLMVISTTYDVSNYYYKRKPRQKIFIAFSVFTNSKKLFSTDFGPSQLTCLHGIRVFTIAGVILKHRYNIISTQSMVTNRIDMKEWIRKYSSAYIIGDTVIVDSFFVMSAIVITYGFSNLMEKGGKLSVLKYYYHRYFRLTSSLAAVILVAVSLYKHLGSGPQWPIMVHANFEDSCRKYWWSCLLYVQNYVNPSKMCLPHTWYLSVDTQLFIFSPILLIVFHKWPKFRIHILGAIVICLSIILFLQAWFDKFYPLVDKDPVRVRAFQNKLHYPSTHARSLSWFVGFAAGYIVYSTKKSKYTISFNRITKKLAFIAYWVFIVAVLYCCLLVGYAVIGKTDYNRVLYALETPLTAPLWAIAVCCLIISCVNGYGGIINWILSNSFMQILSKLSYSMYLLHTLILNRKIHYQRTNLQFGDFEMLYLFWSDFMYTAILSIFWVLAFEYPVIVIEKFIWPHRSKKVASKSIGENPSSTTI